MSYHIIPPHVPSDRPARESRQEVADCPSCRRYTDKAILSRQGVCVSCRELERVAAKRMERAPKPKRVSALCTNCLRWAARPGPMCAKCNARVGGKKTKAKVRLENALQLAKVPGMTAARLRAITGCGEYFADKTMAEFDGTIDRIKACKSRREMEQFSRGQIDTATMILFGMRSISSGISSARRELYHRMTGDWRRVNG